VAGGMKSMSNAPYLMGKKPARGLRMGHGGNQGNHNAFSILVWKGRPAPDRLMGILLAQEPQDK